ncbi:Transcription factor [Pleurostoma richardsiae]|uniref:Transcription factor n=1 Tax=Pleurostoma richardsiae TaxID=41990 RepID=A0AA38RD68_9PEZI|nr:Transcription factor [Pleurostoma richardsiae]
MDTRLPLTLGAASDPQERPSGSRKPPVDPKRRRDKPQLSCNVCRKRKSRCNRARPCETCVRKGLEHKCVYPEHTAVGAGSPGVKHSTGVQERIDELERQVLALMRRVGDRAASPTQREQSPHTSFSPCGGGMQSQSISDPSHVSDNMGCLDLGNSQAHYVEGAHWLAILDRIADLRDQCEANPSPDGPCPAANPGLGPARVDLAHAEEAKAKHREILDAIPPKPLADVLLEKYWAVLSISHTLIHKPTFMKEYSRFWESPADTPVMWVGLLFAMLGIGALHWDIAPSDTEGPGITLPSGAEPQRLVDLYRTKVVQCLVLGQYAKGPAFTIETLLHYLHLNYVPAEDTEIGIWVMLGTLVRMAQRMGYHRDGSHFPRMSAFQAEIRRRVWLVIFELDVIVAAHFGLPRMINPKHCDVNFPRVLLEDESSYDEEELPRSRETEDNVAFMIYKHKLLAMLADITDVTILATPPSHNEVLELFTKLQEVYLGLPSEYRSSETAETSEETPKEFLRRLIIELLYQKARCRLHRGYMLAADTGDCYSLARGHCIDAALEISKHQSRLHHATQPGGKIYAYWRVSSMIRQDFLFAATILCLAVDQNINGVASDSSELKEETVAALSGSYDIWVQWAAKSQEAKRAVHMLQVVLSKARRLSYPGTDKLGPALIQDLDQDVRSIDSPAVAEFLSVPPWAPDTTDLWCLEFGDSPLDKNVMDSWSFSVVSTPPTPTSALGSLHSGT